MSSKNEIPESSLLGLSPEDFKTVLEILKRYVPEQDVWAFGSRVNGKTRPFSDLDLVIHSDHPTDSHVLYELTEAFRNSYLSVKVDVLDWARTQESFRKIIRAQYIVLQSASAPRKGSS